MSTEEILQGLDVEFREAAKNPERYEFVEGPPYRITFTPEHPDMASATVDLENEILEVSYQDNLPLENYSCVKNDPVNNVGLVESYRNHDVHDKTVNSRMYYLVSGDQAFRHTADGYRESLVRRPVEVAKSFEDLYRAALMEDNERGELEWGSPELGYVPTPEEEDFMS